MPSDGRTIRWTVLAVLVLGLVLPIAIGLWETIKPAFGYAPAIGATKPSLAPLNQIIEHPGFWRSAWLSISTGATATVLSFGLAVGFSAATHVRFPKVANTRALAPILAIPHAALAIGLAFVLAPSGWVARLLAPLTGWIAPPDIALVHDPAGMALILGLVIKEVPFFLLVLFSSLTQIDTISAQKAGRALGYGPGIVWAKIIIPQVWPLVRLPFLVVLAYSMSVVDMAMILGPNTPPTLAVMLTRLFFDPDIQSLLTASAGALLQLALIGFAFALVFVAERILTALGLWWLRRGGRGLTAEPGLALAAFAALLTMILGALAIVGLLVWSFAWRWPWPLILPESWSARFWTGSGLGWVVATVNTISLAVVTSVGSVLLAIAWLEGEDRARRGRARWAEALIYVPLILPQIGFLFGLNVFFIKSGFASHYWSVVWAQSLFVFPYVIITLSDPWKALDPRFIRVASALGAGPWRRLFRVKIPVLLGPILVAWAIGVAVSVAQYLPTLFMGAGRIPTLTTEAVTLSSGSDRRVTGVYASLQAMLPLVAYMLALSIPAVMHRVRRSQRGTKKT